MSRAVPEPVLRAYAQMAKEYGPGQAEATALRANSAAMRDVLVYAASEGRLRRYADLLADPTAADDLQPRWSAALARAIALQTPTEVEETLARRLLSSSVPRLPKTAGTLRYRVLQVELLLDALDFESAAQVLAQDDGLAQLHHGYLVADTCNPFAESPFGAYSEWVTRFNLPFASAGLQPVEVAADTGVPFDRLISPKRTERAGGPRISVIVTTFRPDRDALHTAVRSILEQTWQNLDIIIVDDASPAEYDPVLREVSSLDRRIRLKRQEVNGGTYLARNAGIEIARGDLITCQDSDDYSHPQRIELQAEPLLSDPSLAGSRSYCLAVQENLHLHRRGYWPLRPNASSLMFWTETARRLGGFLRARKGADSEFHARLERYVGRPVVDIEKPLAVVRILPASLSRSDFRGGWHHDSRRAFRSTYEAWHRAPSTAELEIAEGSAAPIKVAERLAIESRPQRPLDFVFVGDWRLSTATQVMHMEQMREVARAGRSVGVMHLDSTWFLHGRMADVSMRMQDAISAGEFERVLYDESRSVGTLVAVDPTAIQFPPRHRSALETTRSVLLVDGMSAMGGARIPTFDPVSCQEILEELFGGRCEVAVTGIPGSRTSDFSAEAHYPSLLPIDRLSSDRRTTTSLRAPTLGFELPIYREHEKALRSLLRSLYAQDSAVDVRIIGARQPSVFKGGRSLPPNAVYFTYEDMDFRTFVGSVDFFVLSQATAPSSAILGLSVASGAVALSLAPALHEGDDALLTACTPETLLETVQGLWQNPEALAFARHAALRGLEQYVSPAVELINYGARSWERA